MKRSALGALILVYVAMWCAALVSRHTFERLPHLEDEFAYLFQARIFQEGDVYIETPQPNRAYWQPFLINQDNKRFGKYPPGYPLLLAIGTKLNAPWVVNLWFAGLTVALVYRFGRELYDETAALSAALLMTISPIALLLNGTLMGHTTALFFVMLFIYAMWRLEKNRWAVHWGIVAGLSLGMVVASRPLLGVALATPLVLHSGIRLLWAIFRTRTFGLTIKPLLMVIVFTLGVGSLFPAYNYLVSGDPTTNLYTIIWSYDRVGFGEGHGRYSGRLRYESVSNGIKVSLNTHAGHNLERGWRNVKRDLRCYSRDLFGWVQQPDNPPTDFTVNNECLMDKRGVSWALLPFSLLLIIFGVRNKPPEQPFFWAFWRHTRWSLILFLVAACIILIHLAYWIGAGVYSARYYFEATAALALLSGAGLSGLAQLADKFSLRYGVYALFGGLIFMSVVSYTPNRLAALEGYGRITREPIQEVEQRRQSADIPVMVIAYGDHHWRDIAPFMALTDPYTTNDIIGLRDKDQSYAERLIEQHPNRQVIYLINGKFYPTRFE